VTFAAPARLGLFVVVAGLAIAYRLAQRRRPRYALRFTNLDLLDVVAPDRPGLRRQTLLGAGAGHMNGSIPFELLEPHTGPLLSWDDVLDFKLVLKRWSPSE
jgi:hypothetical protein